MTATFSLGQNYTYVRAERWQDRLPMVPEDCNQHKFRLIHHRNKLAEALIELDGTIAAMDAMIALETANPTAMWTGNFWTGRDTKTKPALQAALNKAIPARAVVKNTDHRGLSRVIFRDQESAAIAKMWGVVVVNDGPLSQTGAVIHGPFRWEAL